MLPANGVISFDGTTISLTTDVIFRPECTGTSVQDISTIVDSRDPFYASTIPQTFVIAATTVIAWILVIMLIITPRTNFLGQSASAPGFGSGFGIIGGATGGNTNLIGVGSRPWLQKVAALTVAISLTIATADTLECAKEQYQGGYMDAAALRDDVLGSLEIRVTRVISDVFLWLAQVQTLIRLFPRHKEKVLIKWIGFALILLDSLFSCLNSFGIQRTRTHSPREFVDAIPALSYLFELALGLLYAAWVIYYSLTKRRYAFYHKKMPSISLIALLSLVAILTPVVFFVTDVSNQDVAGWGDYFRWVGAAAASVVVWEWVERIEALERDEKKDGILGREIFDGDEMLDANPSDEGMWSHSRYDRNRYRRDGSDSGGTQSSSLEKGFSSIAESFRRRTQKVQQRLPFGRTNDQAAEATPEPAPSMNGNPGVAFGTLPKPRRRNEENIISGPTPPPAVASPVSRADTTSAASTVYIVRRDSTPNIPEPVQESADTNDATDPGTGRAKAQDNARDPEKEAISEVEEDVRPNRNRGGEAWVSVLNPFKRKRTSPPAEVQQARRNSNADAARVATPAHNFSRWDFKNRIGVLAAETGDKWRDRRKGRPQLDELPVTVIPAQPRGSGRTWTPPVLTQRDESAPGVESGESSTDQRESCSFTLTTNSNTARSTQLSPAPLRADTESPIGAGGTRTSGVSPELNRSSLTPETNRSTPPRADEIRPVAGAGSPTIIPAPNRRSIRSPPLSTHQESLSASSSRSKE